MSDWELPAAIGVAACLVGWYAGRPHRRAARESAAREARASMLPRCGRCGVKWDPDEGLHECANRTEER